MEPTGMSISRAEADAAQQSAAVRLRELIRAGVSEGASDLPLRAGQRPRLRIDGELYQLESRETTEEDLRDFLHGMLTPAMLERFERTRELDFSYSLPGASRLRFNLFNQQGTMCAAVRLIPERVP